MFEGFEKPGVLVIPNAFGVGKDLGWVGGRERE